GAAPGQVVRIAGQGRDLQAGSRFRIAEIRPDGAVRLEPVAGGDGFTLNRRDLEREVREGAAFEVEGAALTPAPRAGVPSTGRPPLAARMGNREVEVASFEDASRKFLELKGAVDVGGMGVVELVDQSGQAVGWIGPQGEVYSGDFQ